VHEVHLIPWLVPARRESYREAHGSLTRADQPLMYNTGVAAAWYCRAGRQRGRAACHGTAPAPLPRAPGRQVCTAPLHCCVEVALTGFAL
jgi:hypothetical protein